MELQHISVKLFVNEKLSIDPERFIETFHNWVANQALPELLIDVADYRHVPCGPTVALIGHEADYVLDNADNEYGLRYTRKASVEGDDPSRLQQALGSVGHACQLLESEFGESLSFSRTKLAIAVNDRAIAPNTPESFAALRSIVENWLRDKLRHSEFELHAHDDPRRMVGFVAMLTQPLDLNAFQLT